MGQVVKLAVANGHPLAGLVFKFLDDLAAQGKSPATLSSYRSDLTQFQRFSASQLGGGDPPAGAITAELLRAYMMGQTPLALATRARRQAALNSFFDWAVRWDFIEHNPATKLPRIQREEAVPRPMKADDVEQVLKAIPASKLRDRLLFTLLAETGMRIGEALGVHVEDVDLTPDNELVVIRKPKGHRQRTVVLDDAPRSRVLLKRFVGQGGRKSGWLFRGDPAKRGRAEVDGPLSYRAAHERWRCYCEIAGVTATIHQLRHSVGTALINDGLPHEAVRRRLGHRSMEMVRRYGEMSDEMLRKHLRERERTGRARSR